MRTRISEHGWEIQETQPLLRESQQEDFEVNVWPVSHHGYTNQARDWFPVGSVLYIGDAHIELSITK